MRFVDRNAELARLHRLAESPEGGLAVLYGRRRIGKTRLLLEWSARHGGLYWVADQSAAEIQRRYFAAAVAGRLPGFAEVEYRDWQSLLSRLAREAQAARWRGGEDLEAIAGSRIESLDPVGLIGLLGVLEVRPAELAAPGDQIRRSERRTETLPVHDPIGIRHPPELALDRPLDLGRRKMARALPSPVLTKWRLNKPRVPVCFFVFRSCRRRRAETA